MKTLTLAFILSFLGCGIDTPTGPTTKPQPKPPITSTPPDMSVPYERLVDRGDGVYFDKELEIFCKPSNGKCLPFPAEEVFTDALCISKPPTGIAVTGYQQQQFVKYVLVGADVYKANGKCLQVPAGSVYVKNGTACVRDATIRIACELAEKVENSIFADL